MSVCDSPSGNISPECGAYISLFDQSTAATHVLIETLAKNGVEIPQNAYRTLTNMSSEGACPLGKRANYGTLRKVLVDRVRKIKPTGDEGALLVLTKVVGAFGPICDGTTK